MDGIHVTYKVEINEEVDPSHGSDQTLTLFNQLQILNNYINKGINSIYHPFR